MLKKALIITVSMLALAACTDPKGATEALEDAGYKGVTITGYNTWACSDDDTFHTGFEAIGPSGRHVRGTVCSGTWGKDQTIRLKRR